MGGGGGGGGGFYVVVGGGGGGGGGGGEFVKLDLWGCATGTIPVKAQVIFVTLYHRLSSPNPSTRSACG